MIASPVTRSTPSKSPKSLKSFGLLLTACALLVLGTAAAQAADSAPAAEPAASQLTIYNDGVTAAPNVFFMGTPTNWAEPVPAKGSINLGSIKSEVTQVNTPGDGRKVTWTGGTGQIYFQSKSALDQEEYLDADGALVFDAIVHEAPDDSVIMRVDCRYPCVGVVEASNILKSLPLGKKSTIKIPLSCFAKTGTRFSAVNTPFLIYSSVRFSMSFANVRWVKGAAKDADAKTACGA